MTDGGHDSAPHSSSTSGRPRRTKDGRSSFRMRYTSPATAGMKGIANAAPSVPMCSAHK